MKPKILMPVILMIAGCLLAPTHSPRTSSRIRTSNW